MMIINKFNAFAGFKINYLKSTLLPISSDSTFFTSHPILQQFSLSTTPLKYLIILIPPSLSNLYHINLKPVIQSILNSLLGWRNLTLSLSGGISVIKSVLFPKPSYVIQMLPILPSKMVLHTFKLNFALFLWKRSHITFSRLFLPKEKGGFGLPDVFSCAQAVHFRHITDWLLNRSIFSNYALERALFAPYSECFITYS